MTRASFRLATIAATLLVLVGIQVPIVHAQLTCFGQAPTLVGSEGADTLTGTPGDDVIIALGGADQISGLAGNDIVCADGGDDVINGGDGHDTIEGADGNDTINGDAGTDLSSYYFSPNPVQASLATGTATGDGSDTMSGIEDLLGSEWNDTFTGDANDNFLIGDWGNDLLMAGAGWDSLDGGIGDDTLNGGAGQGDFDMAFYDFSAAPVTVNLSTGKALGDGSDNLVDVEDVLGSPFNDVLVGNSGSNFLSGIEGDDSLFAGSGDDLLVGGAGNDVLNGLATKSIASWSGSSRTSPAGARGASLSTVAALYGFDPAGAGGIRTSADVYSATRSTQANVSDIDVAMFNRSATPVTANLNSGQATGEGADVLTEVEDLIGSDFADVLTGNADTNFLIGNEGNDQLSGGANWDFLAGEGGNDMLDGGDDDWDWVSFLDYSGDVQVDLGAGTSTGDGSDTLTGIENIEGGLGNDTLVGDDAMNFIDGGWGDGTGGDDVLDGAGGTSDLAWYASAPGGVTVDLAQGTSSGAAGSDTLSNFESVVGSANYADTLTGSDAPNYLDGWGGNDRISGGGGNDWIVGDQGNDLLSGGSGPYDTLDLGFASKGVTVDLAAGTATGEGTDKLDTIEDVLGSNFKDQLKGDGKSNALFGEGGNDKLVGRGGPDILRGGPGTDTLDGGPSKDSCRQGENVSGCEKTSVPTLPDAPPSLDTRQPSKRHR